MWRIVKRRNGYNPEKKTCNLCPHEKFEILSHKGNNLLNKKDETISNSRYSKNILISSFDTEG